MSAPVWTIVIYDNPVTTREAANHANRFRNMLFDLGFSRAQLSVYIRYLPNATSSTALSRAIRQAIPPHGQVRILRLSDTQWATAEHWFGPDTARAQEQPDGQGLLF